MTGRCSRIRTAVVDDVAAMQRVRASVVENRLSDPSRVRTEDYLAHLAPPRRTWVAEQQGCIVGFAAADRARAEVWALFVEPDREGRGIGRSLLEVLTAWLFESGAPEISLTTDPGTRAERVYLAAGWRRAGVEPNGEVRYRLSRSAWCAPRSREA